MDLPTGQRWTVRPNAGRIPWWLLLPSRRVPQARLGDYLRLLSLTRRTDDATVATALRHGWLYWRLAEPLAIAALNTPPRDGLARLLGAVLRETLARGGSACIPRFPRAGLSDALIDPAVATLRQRGATVHFSRRIAGLEIAGDRVVALLTPDGPLKLAPDDAVVLAVPPWVATSLLPGLIAPDAFESILNIHFRVAADPGEAGFIGLIRGTAEWVFVKPDHVSVTISAANRMVDQPAEAIAAAVWPDVRAALDLEGDMPPLPRGQGAPRHLRRHRNPGAAAPGRPHRPDQPRAGRRLDRHRPARHDRGRHPLRPHRRRGVARGLTGAAGRVPAHRVLPRHRAGPRRLTYISFSALRDRGP